MKSLQSPLSTDVNDVLDYESQEQEIEVPSLPIRVIIDQKEFEKKVQSLRKVYEYNKPVGNFY